MRSPRLDERRCRYVSLHLGGEGLVVLNETRSQLGYEVNGVGSYDCRSEDSMIASRLAVADASRLFVDATVGLTVFETGVV